MSATMPGMAIYIHSCTKQYNLGIFVYSGKCFQYMKYVTGEMTGDSAKYFALHIMIYALMCKYNFKVYNISIQGRPNKKTCWFLVTQSLTL